MGVCVVAAKLLCHLLDSYRVTAAVREKAEEPAQENRQRSASLSLLVVNKPRVCDKLFDVSGLQVVFYSRLPGVVPADDGGVFQCYGGVLESCLECGAVLFVGYASEVAVFDGQDSIPHPPANDMVSDAKHGLKSQQSDMSVLCPARGETWQWRSWGGEPEGSINGCRVDAELTSSGMACSVASVAKGCRADKVGLMPDKDVVISLVPIAVEFVVVRDAVIKTFDMVEGYILCASTANTGGCPVSVDPFRVYFGCPDASDNFLRVVLHAQIILFSSEMLVKKPGVVGRLSLFALCLTRFIKPCTVWVYAVVFARLALRFFRIITIIEYDCPPSLDTRNALGGALLGCC